MMTLLRGGGSLDEVSLPSLEELYAMIFAAILD